MDTQNSFFSTSGRWDGRSEAYKYPNPFCDIASMYLPTSLNDAFGYMEYLLMTMPPFMSVINRVVSYFLTDIEVHDVSDDVRDKYEKLFDTKVHMIQTLQDIGKDYFCFGGDTPVVTKGGVVPIRTLAGKKVKVLSIDGKWHDAEFKSYGKQKTREIAFGSKLKVRATDEHRWWVYPGDAGKAMFQTTTGELKPWLKVPLQKIPRPVKNRDFETGVIHGAVMGLRPRPYSYEKEFIEALESNLGISSSRSFKDVPKKDVSASYWYGIFAGMSSVCGYFQKKAGYFFLTHRNRAILERCRKGFEFAGMRTKALATRKVWCGQERYYLPFNCSLLGEEDFLCEDHKAALRESRSHDRSRDQRCTGIAKIGELDREEEVFCCVEPETHTFTLGTGVVTGNCYGNAFVSLYLPFDRYLVCPNCGVQVHISKIPYDFDCSTGNFMCECPRCKMGKVAFKRVDRRMHDPSKVNVIRWNPKRMRLKVHPISGEIKYYYRLDEKFVQRVREGDPFYINTSQWGFIQTCIGSDKNKSNGAEHLFEFQPDQLYHMKDTVFSGLSDKIKGWAIPPLLPYFKLAYYIQLMRRYDEAVALDFILPFRILYPQGQGPSGDALSMVSMQTFIAAMSRMIEKKRAKMTTIEVAPYAIGYELIGGEAKQLAPKESIQAAEQELLNAMGFPQELFSGTLTLQAAPVALRLFEREWNPFVDGMNTVLQWFTDQISKYFMWDHATVKLTPITLADDIEKKGLTLQLAQGQQISNQTALRSLGYDYMDEQQRVIKEQQDIQKLQEKAMADAQAQQANGAMGGGGGSGDGSSGMNGPGGQVGATPGDINEQAKQIAQELIAANNPAHTRQTLAQIKQTNPTLWAMVKGQLQDQRQQLASQGQQLMVQQMQQGG